MQALTNNAAFWMMLIVALCAVYLLPTLIGAARRVDQLALVFLVNLIGGTTGVGWLAAMILAFGPRRLPPIPTLPWPPPPAGHAEARSVLVLQADAREPDHFG
jgi:hypothetical protein